jgi:hypothetical protein
MRSNGGDIYGHWPGLTFHRRRRRSLRGPVALVAAALGISLVLAAYQSSTHAAASLTSATQSQSEAQQLEAEAEAAADARLEKSLR